MRNPQATTSISCSERSAVHSEAHDDLSLAPSVSVTTSSSSSSSSFPTRPSQASHIRCRLLYRLGIDPKQPIQRSVKPVASSAYDRFRSINNPTPYLQPLRDDVDSSGATGTRPNNYHHDIKTRNANGTLAHSPQNTTERRYRSSSITSNIRTVRFDNNVLVVPIPSRNAYSNRIKKALWRNKTELRETADRNRCEYLSEGWEWNKVLEDEDMYIEAATGEKIHPCWVEDEDVEEDAEFEEDEDFEGLERRNSFYGECEETEKTNEISCQGENSTVVE